MRAQGFLRLASGPREWGTFVRPDIEIVNEIRDSSVQGDAWKLSPYQTAMAMRLRNVILL